MTAAPWSRVGGLHQSLAPTLFSTAYIEAPLPVVSDAMVSLAQRTSGAQVRTVNCCLADAVALLEPLTCPRTMQLLMATHSAWTAYFDNGIKGGDTFTPASLMARELGCRALTAEYTPAIRDPARQGGGILLFGGVQLAIYGPLDSEWLNLERGISVIQGDRRWEFDTFGDPLPFEDTEAYTARRVRDRFTPEMLVRYCRELGVDPYSEAFYGSRGTLIAIDGLPARSLSRSEARVDMGLE